MCVCVCSGTASSAFRPIWAARQPHKTCLCVRNCGCLSHHSSPVQGFSDPDVQKKKLNSELANGRLAMMAIIGMFFQDGLTGYLAKFCKAIPHPAPWLSNAFQAPLQQGSAWGDWANYTESPLRAFENELGVQARAHCKSKAVARMLERIIRLVSREGSSGLL